MGHDIYAYAGVIVPADLHDVASAEELGEEIAYLRGEYGLYAALDAEFYNAKISGIGIGRWFTREQLQVAERRLIAREVELQKAGFSCEPAIEFIRNCLIKLPPERQICYIDFG